MQMNGPLTAFFDDPVQDRLLAMITSLGAEVAALREELATVRELIAEKGLVSAEEVAAHAPSPAARAERDRARETLVSNLLFPLQQACDALTRSTPSEAKRA